MADSIIIIGAGIAGLSAGCYGRMNDYRTRIFEMHDKPGGVCTSWSRKGYTFDGCIHWLVGSKEGPGLNQIWRELGALQDRRVIDHEEFARIEGAEGKTLIVYTDVDRLERQMLDLSPSDTGSIEELADAIRRLSRLEVPLGRPKPIEGLKTLPGLLRAAGPLRKLAKVTVEEYARRFKDPFLRQAVNLIFDLPDAPMISLAMTLAWLNRKDAGYPEGGSLEFSRAIERRYLGLGGDVSYKSKVENILVEGGRAVGVTLADGSEHRADIVISAADGHATIFDMLGGRFVDEEVRGFYDRWPLWDPLVQVSLGVARDLSATPHTVSFPLEEPVDAGGKKSERLYYMHYCFDPTMAPAGKSVVVVLLPSDYDQWVRLHEDPGRYSAEKERIAGEVIGALERHLPGLRDQVEEVDVATPLTL